MATVSVDKVKAIIGSAGQDVEDDQDLELMRDTATIDPKNLCVVDPTPLDKRAFRKNKEAFMVTHAKAAMQLLFQELETLPFEQDKQGRLVQLPAQEVLDIPREKPLPKPKPLTRWEKFAQEKGIQKRKRSQMVYDEDADKYKARHGKDRIGDNEKKGPWLMLGSNGKGNDWDPYAARLEEKTKTKEKQTKQEQRNVDEQNQSGYRGPLTVSGKLMAKDATLDKQGQKADKADALVVAQRSTASMGKFDRRVEDEPEIKRQKGKRRKLEGNIHQDLGGEKGKSLKLLDKMIGGKADAKFNTTKASNLHQQIVDRAIKEKHAHKGDRAGGTGKKRRSAVGKEKKFGKKKK